MDYTFSYRTLAEALYLALTGDAFYVTMEQSVKRGSPREAMIRYMDYSMVEAERYGRLMVPEQDDFGASVWAKPLEHPLESQKQLNKKKFIKSQMGPASLATYEAITTFMAEQSADRIEENAWYLSIVGLHPDYQGKGLGPDLVSGVLQETDRLNLPTFLETFTLKSIPFYQRLGYHPVEKIYEPTCQADYWLMARKSPDRES